ncbi:MAG: ABC transporter permease [Candidatus Aminicenantaceae bacterium]
MKSRILPIVRKELIHILRDVRSLYLALGLPLVLLILFGYAITLDVNNVPVGIINQDGSFLSRDLIARIQASKYFDLLHISSNYSGMEKLLDEGKVRIIVIIPSHFSRDLYKGIDAPLQLLIDGSDNNTALVALGYLSKIIHAFSSSVVLQRINEQGVYSFDKIPPLDVESIVWYNPGLRSTNFIVPGLIAVVMMILSAMLTSLTIAREWETGTMEQLIATPARAHEIIIGKIIPYFFLGMIQMSLVVLTGTLLFKVPLRGSIFLLILVSGLFLICGLGIGLFISTVTKSQQLAFMFSIIFTLLPSFILSGFIFPVSSMPRIIQFISYLVPAKYFLVILRGIFLKGNGLSILWPEVFLLLIFGLLLILACSKRLKLSLE